MQEMLRVAESERRNYREKISAYYEKQRLEFEEKKARKEVDAAQKLKVIHLRRQREWDELRRVRKEQNEMKLLSREKLLADWRIKWEQRIENNLKDHEQKLAQVLDAPKNALDDVQHKALEASIKSRAKVLAVRAVLCYYKQVNLKNNRFSPIALDLLV